MRYEVELLFPEGCELKWDKYRYTRRHLGYIAYFPHDVTTAEWRINAELQLESSAFAEMRWRAPSRCRRPVSATDPFAWLCGRTRVVLIGRGRPKIEEGGTP